MQDPINFHAIHKFHTRPKIVIQDPNFRARLKFYARLTIIMQDQHFRARLKFSCKTKNDHGRPQISSKTKMFVQYCNVTINNRNCTRDNQDARGYSYDRYLD